VTVKPKEKLQHHHSFSYLKLNLKAKPWKSTSQTSGLPVNELMWYVIIHLTLVISALLMGYLDKMTKH